MAGERLIREAADSGIPRFQYVYGNLLERGLTGVYVKGDQEQYFRTEPRIDLAKEYWELAAKQGHEKAQLKLEKEYEYFVNQLGENETNSLCSNKPLGEQQRQ